MTIDSTDPTDGLIQKLDQDAKKLRLLAKDLEDLQLISAHLQDALLPLTTMIYDSSTSTFTALANRFCWEKDSIEHEGMPLYHRTHAGLCFRNVEKVFYKNIDLNGSLRTLNLLAVNAEPQSSEEGSVILNMIFSGESHIRLKVKDLHCHLGDIHQAWTTRSRPKHIHEHLEERARA